MSPALRPLALALVPLPLHLVVAPAEELFLLPERRGLLELLRLKVHVLLADDALDLLADLLDLGRRGQRHEPGARGRLVDDVDGLVGELPVGDVAVGELDRRVDGLIGDLHPMMSLVLVAQALDDLDRFRHGRGAYDDGLEAALESAVLLDVLAVFVERRGADGLDLAARERGLEHVRGVDGAFRGARPDQRVELVEEEHDVLRLADLFHHRLQPLLELPAVLGTGYERAQVQLEEPLLRQHVGHLVTHDALGEPLDDGGLADARLADQHGVVLGAPRQNLDDALDFRLPADDRIELALAGQLGEVPGELVEDRGLGALLGPRVVLVTQERQGLLADLVEARPEGFEDLGRYRLPFLHEPEEKVLGADVVVPELAGFFDAQLEDPLGLGRERHLAEGQGLREAGQRALDFRLDGFEPEAEPLEDGCCDALAVTDETQQDVLRAHEIMPEAPGLFSRQDDDPPRPLRKSLEHLEPSRLRVRTLKG